MGVRDDLVYGGTDLLIVGLLPPAGIYLLVRYFDRRTRAADARTPGTRQVPSPASQKIVDDAWDERAGQEAGDDDRQESADQLAGRGLPLTGAAVIVGLGLALWLLIVLIVTATSSSGQLTESQLRPGDCLRNSTNLGPSLGNDGPWPSTFTAVPCAMPHVAEIIFAGDPWPQSLAYPGFAVIANQGPARCASAFRAYDGIAPAASEFSIADITPDSSTWASGDRLVVCIAYVSDFSGPSYGGDLWDYSIKGSHR